MLCAVSQRERRYEFVRLSSNTVVSANSIRVKNTRHKHCKSQGKKKSKYDIAKVHYNDRDEEKCAFFFCPRVDISLHTVYPAV